MFVFLGMALGSCVGEERMDVYSSSVPGNLWIKINCLH